MNILESIGIGFIAGAVYFILVSLFKNHDRELKKVPQYGHIGASVAIGFVFFIGALGSGGEPIPMHDYSP